MVMRRKQNFFIANVELTRLDRMALDEIKRRLGLYSDGDAVRVSLCNLAKHVEIEQIRSDSLFAVRGQRKPPAFRIREYWLKPGQNSANPQKGRPKAQVQRKAHELRG